MGRRCRHLRWIDECLGAGALRRDDVERGARLHGSLGAVVGRTVRRVFDLRVVVVVQETMKMNAEGGAL